MRLHSCEPPEPGVCPCPRGAQPTRRHADPVLWCFRPAYCSALSLRPIRSSKRLLSIPSTPNAARSAYASTAHAKRSAGPPAPISRASTTGRPKEAKRRRSYSYCYSRQSCLGCAASRPSRTAKRRSSLRYAPLTADRSNADQSQMLLPLSQQPSHLRIPRTHSPKLRPTRRKSLSRSRRSSWTTNLLQTDTLLPHLTPTSAPLLPKRRLPNFYDIFLHLLCPSTTPLANDPIKALPRHTLEPSLYGMHGRLSDFLYNYDQAISRSVVSAVVDPHMYDYHAAFRTSVDNYARVLDSKSKVKSRDLQRQPYPDTAINHNPELRNAQ